MTEQEYLKLAKKYLAGEASPEEYELLRRHNENFQLSEDDWTPEMGEKELIYQQLTESVFDGVEAGLQRRKLWTSYGRIAAVLLVFLAVGIVFWMRKGAASAEIAKAPAKGEKIKPAGNVAYLTLSDGSKVSLGEGEAKLGIEHGIQLKKGADGLLLYDLSHANPEIRDSEPVYNTLTTPKGAHYRLILADGTKVWLNASSSITFPVTFSGDTRDVELSGEAYFEVVENKHKPFTVKTKRTEVKVLGTHFNVSAYADDPITRTTLLEGSVQLKHGTQAALLLPGQKGEVAEGNPALRVAKADLQEAVGWKNGLFIFRDENIVEVMKKVARWYDVQVEFEGNVKTKAFGGTVSRFKDITEILDLMQLAGGIHYKIEGRRVVIMD
ncbi:FecR family protein [Pedobacter sp. SYSU D00535]|uniref:FecR family protein n=1 Tax=Pedobacter sp. SYSU D00535 TaxID=2810308 RepID=UPI001A9777D9|nr:FecR family protein [Pedobacter sp. SYSU D00535]